MGIGSGGESRRPHARRGQPAVSSAKFDPSYSLPASFGVGSVLRGPARVRIATPTLSSGPVTEDRPSRRHPHHRQGCGARAGARRTRSGRGDVPAGLRRRSPLHELRRHHLIFSQGGATARRRAGAGDVRPMTTHEVACVPCPPTRGPALSLLDHGRGADVVPVGGEFQVNTYTSANQEKAQVSADASGGFIVVWQSGDTTGRGPTARERIAARRYDATGVGRRGVRREHLYAGVAGRIRRSPSAPTGDFVITWAGRHLLLQPGQFGVGRLRAGLHGCRREAGAEPARTRPRPDFREHRGGNGGGRRFRGGLDELPAYYATGEATGAARASSASATTARVAPVSGEFQVNTYTTGYQATPDRRRAAVASWSCGAVGRLRSPGRKRAQA